MTDEELALVTRLEGYRTTCCDDSRTVPDLIAIIRRLESEVAALKIDNKELQLNFNALIREAQLSENRGAVEALEKAIVFLWRNNGESDPTHAITVEDKQYIRWCAVFDELGQLKSSYQPPQPKGER